MNCFFLQLTGMPINKPPAFLGIVFLDSFFRYFPDSLIPFLTQLP